MVRLFLFLDHEGVDQATIDFANTQFEADNTCAPEVEVIEVEEIVPRVACNWGL